ncbi:STAS-like domain-containing protein [Acetobacterium wieringae]|uniref:STAS-like domain-containing protein n=1 Tax=Acetobacterium wieringae TaxID=52694 RepID=UPI0026F021A0|nr:STAS-like domain-containing protein [Acetobacterium wieringae]
MMELLKEEGSDMIEIKLNTLCKNKYPMSRSEARRILKNLSAFKEVTLDFEEINNIGQAFGHEIFVVFQNKTSKIKINYINANDEVKGMITRILNTENCLINENPRKC